MKKRIYISADYAEGNGDRNVVNELNKWGCDNLHLVDFVDMAKVVSGSVSADPDCRICDLKREFNTQINMSSIVIIVVGDKTASRTAGSLCKRVNQEQGLCWCTPYKQNTNGMKLCRVYLTSIPKENDDFGCINSFSYIEHEFQQAKKKNKKIVVIYNSTRNEPSWLPTYLKSYEDEARPFWMYNSLGYKVGNYSFIKEVLEF